jgi:hypothetical protein
LKGVKLSRDILGVTINETPVTQQADIVEKYESLKTLKGFFQAINRDVISEPMLTSKSKKKGKRVEEVKSTLSAAEIHK